MSTIETNTVATVHYRGTLTGTEDEFDSSFGKEPLSFLVGHGQMIPGFEAALMGKAAGDKVTFDIPCAEAYGEYDEEGQQVIPAAQMPEGVQVGDRLAAQTESGHVIPVRVLKIEEGQVTLDFNHELAGQDLTFEVEVIEVRVANEDELAHGHAHGPDGHHEH